MLVGLAVFVAPTRVTQVLIFSTAVLTSISLLILQDSVYLLAVNAFAALALMIAAVAAVVALNRGGLPENAGAPPDPGLLNHKVGPFRFDVLIYLMVLLCVPIFAILTRQSEVGSWLLVVFGGLALGYVLLEALRGTQIERERLFVVLILTMFSLLFWAFFEQAGSSMALFIDRNIDRVFEARTVGASDMGNQVTFRIAADTSDAQLKQLPPLTQEQLGRENGDSTMADEIADAMRLVNDSKPTDAKLSADSLSA
jgi:POT family proton-dependent oligopeptide transporter